MVQDQVRPPHSQMALRFAPQCMSMTNDRVMQAHMVHCGSTPCQAALHAMDARLQLQSLPAGAALLSVNAVYLHAHLAPTPEHCKNQPFCFVHVFFRTMCQGMRD